MFTIKVLLILLAAMATLMVVGHVRASLFTDD